MDDFEVANGPTRVRITGLSKTIRALSKAGADSESMRDLMHSIGRMVIGNANPPVRTGRLAGDMRAGRGKTKAVIRVGRASIPYAGVVHYGWPARNIKAQPFYITALQSSQGKALQMLDDGLEDILRKNDLI